MLDQRQTVLDRETDCVRQRQTVLDQRQTMLDRDRLC